jgi:preprotein translocase SecE subunit
MATAVEPGSQPRTPGAPAALPLASLIGAVYVVAAVAAVFFAVPAFWSQYVAPNLSKLGYIGETLRWGVQLAVLVGLVWFGRRLLGDNPPRGIHGGIFLVISWAITIFFLWRAVAMNVEGGAGMIAAGLLAAFLLFLAVRSFTAGRSRRWAVALEEQGWFTTAAYKPTLGQKARRLTVLGLGLLGGTGVWALRDAGTLPANWTLAMPFEDPSRITVLPDAHYTVPILLALVIGWFAWRAVNIPTFAEFLIATEAEMNKVSWTPKKRLGQDTVVVLTTTLILTLFLLVVDLFWGWLLSNIGILPDRPQGADKPGVTEQVRW